MYEIYANELLIHSDITPLESVKAINPVLHMADSAAGSLDLSLPPINTGYSQEVVKRMATDIIVKCDNEEIWRGRIIQDYFDFWNNRRITCEGELAFLNDSIQPPHRYLSTETTIESFLYSLIDIHNAQVGANRRFEKGMVTVTDGDQQEDSDAIYRFTNYETTLECINDKLVERLKGHLRIRHQDGKRYLDYISDDTLGTNTQVIRFGINLIDFIKNIDMTELATAIVPRGNRLDLEESDPKYIEGLEPYLTVESLGEKQETITNPDGTTRTEVWHDANSMFVKNPTAVDNFGWVPVVIDWSNVSDANTLYSKAVKYLKDEQYEKTTLEIKAIDLKYLSDINEPIKYLSKLRCISEPHGMDHTFIVSAMDLDLSNPGNSIYTLGSDIKLSLTQTASKVNQAILDEIEKIPSKSEILKAAERNAYQMIMGQDGSYVHLIPGTNGGIKRIEVTDGPTYDSEADNDDDPNTDPFPDSLNRWIWTVGGLGHIGRESYSDTWDGWNKSTGEFDDPTLNVAMTMDGQIVADRITAGHMNCDRLDGGTINGQAIKGGTITGSTIRSYYQDNTNRGYTQIEGGSIEVVADDDNYLRIRSKYDPNNVYTSFGRNIAVMDSIFVMHQPRYLGYAIEDAYNEHSSDIKLKKNIEDIPIKDSKGIILGARPRYYEFKKSIEGGIRSGVVAQELREELDKIGNHTAIERESKRRYGQREVLYEDFIAHLINCIKDLYSEVDKLKSKLQNQ